MDNWNVLRKIQPEYYVVVNAILYNGESKQVWRASNGDKDLYTEAETDLVFYTNEIVFWQPLSDEEHKRVNAFFIKD